MVLLFTNNLIKLQRKPNIGKVLHIKNITDEILPKTSFVLTSTVHQTPIIINYISKHSSSQPTFPTIIYLVHLWLS